MIGKNFCWGLVLAFFVTGCASSPLPLRKKEVNKTLFRDPAEAEERVGMLAPGMSEKDFFKILNITPKVPYTILSIKDIQFYLFGDSRLYGPLGDLEEFRQRLARFRGYSIEYRALDLAAWVSGPTSFIRALTGHDILIVGLFDNGGLTKALLVGKKFINEREKIYIWDVFGGLVKEFPATAIDSLK